MTPPKSRWEVCRIKDRLGRTWDAEQSGGNRDILINGWLTLGATSKFIVEIQLHLRDLFKLKGDLHTLYNGARVLGAMDDNTLCHEGLINDKVLDLAKRGVLRKLGVAFSELNKPHISMLHQMLQTEPCALLTLDMTRCHVRQESRPGSASTKPAFEGTTLSSLLEPESGRLACRRLRQLKLSSTGVEGELPSCLEQCEEMVVLELKQNNLCGSVPPALLSMGGLSLQVLNLSRNSLSGEVPDAFSDCHSLKELFLSWNQFTGPLPPSISECKNLAILNVAGNHFSGEIPSCFGRLQKMQKLFVDDNDFSGSLPAEVRRMSPK